MSLYVALQMDPIENVAINADSTFGLVLRPRRGAPVVPVYRRPADLSRGACLRERTADHASARAEMLISGTGSLSIWPSSMSSGCARTRLSIWAMSHRPICWIASAPIRWS